MIVWSRAIEVFINGVRPFLAFKVGWRFVRSAVTLPILVSIVVGCTSFGGRPVRVSFTSDPAGAEVFMVPRIDWDINGGAELLKDAKLLERYRVGGTQVTPFDQRVGFQEQVLVLRFKGKFAWKEVTPDDGDKLFLKFPVEAL